MQNDQRLTTDRWFGTIDNRLGHLRKTFEYIDNKSPEEHSLIQWILETTNAESEDAVRRRLRFLESTELIQRTNGDYQLTEHSRDFLDTDDAQRLFTGLRRNVAGFDELLTAAAEQPLTDEKCREILAEADDFDGSIGVAIRHREWLQVLGFLKKSNGEYTLTEQGESVSQKILSEDTTDRDSDAPFELNKQYVRQELHDKYGGNRQAGISPCSDYPFVFLFTGAGGDDYGYDDDFHPDGTFEYTGGGREGDMEFNRGNRAIRDHQNEGRELHLFWQEGDGTVRYLGQFEYDGYEWVELPDKHGDTRDAIRFSLSPVGPIMVRGDAGFKRLDPPYSEEEGDTTATDAISNSNDQEPAIFMARGYKDNPFHRHVARSLANYLSESKRTKLKETIREYQKQGSNSFDAAPVLELLDSETVTAWGTKDKTEDVELFRQMEAGDRFIMRTGQPNVVRFIQTVNLRLGKEVPLDLRKAISDDIWTSQDYEYIWFSEDNIVDLHCPEEQFEEIIGEAVDGFDIKDWFPAQGKNFTRIGDDVLAALGGPTEFLDRLSNEFDGQPREPGVENYFLLDSGTGATGLTDEYFFELKQTAVENWDIFKEAENDAKVIVHDQGTILGYGRVGNIEGERRDDGIYKLANIIDWHPIAEQSLESISTKIDLGFVNVADGTGASHLGTGPLMPISQQDYDAIQDYLSEESGQSPPDTGELDYWSSLKQEREYLHEFVDNPSRQTLEALLNPVHFSSQLSHTFESDVDQLLEQNDPEDIAETLEIAAKNDAPASLEREIHGLGWTKTSELLRMYHPEKYVMHTPRSQAGMEALGYAPPGKIESEEEYLEFTQQVREAVEQFDLANVAVTVSEEPIPDWATELDMADYVFSRHYDEDHEFELPPADICAGEVPEAPYYWVSQTSSPEEIEHEYLEAKPDNQPGHDLSRLEEGDIVFHFTEGEIIGYSEVTQTVTHTITEDGLRCRVDVSLTEFDQPLAFANVFGYLFQSDVRLDDYYPVNYAGLNQGYLFNLSQDAGEYLLEQAGIKESHEHPLLQHYRNTEDCNLWRFSASPETLLTVIRRGAIPLSDGTNDIPNQRDKWQTTQPGDVIMLTVDSSDEFLDAASSESSQEVIGVAVVGSCDQKSERWFDDEHSDLCYPYILTLDECHVTSDVSDINFEQPFFSLESDDRRQEIDALTANSIAEVVASDMGSSHLDQQRLFTGDNYAIINRDPDSIHEFLRELLKELGLDLQEISPSVNLPGMLPPPAAPLDVEQRDELETELTRTGQIVLFGPPGTGKTFTATRFARWWIHEQTDRPKATRFRTVTFHPSFSYEDFMEGLTAEATDEGEVAYRYKDGTFKSIVEEAREAYLRAESPENAPRYVLLIDEINRGNLSQIFGEAITQLEMDKRLGQSEAVTVQWAHSGESVAIPPNLYMIGTMNTADRSIALVDAALRRRFGFLSFPPDYQVFVDEYEFSTQREIQNLADDVIATNRIRAGSNRLPDHYPLLALSIRALQAINENIVEQSDLTKGKRIGHSYLLGIDSESELIATWQHDILPLLEEYYFGDFDRLRKEVFDVDVTAETSIDSRLFDQVNNEIARIDADDLEVALADFVERHDFR